MPGNVLSNKRTVIFHLTVMYMIRNFLTNMVALSNAQNLTSRLNYTTAKPILDVEANRMVWIDMEMTGLNIDTDKILEVACIITDEQLNIVAEGPDLIINQPQDILNGMNEWCRNQHGKSGLTEAVLKSELTLAEAEEQLFAFIRKHVSEKNSPLAGNSVYMDRLFLRRFMPRVDDYLHYRIVDVSTIKELCRRWNSDVYRSAPKKGFSHRALEDIRESIEELKYYKSSFFKH